VATSSCSEVDGGDSPSPLTSAESPSHSRGLSHSCGTPPGHRRPVCQGQHVEGRRSASGLGSTDDEKRGPTVYQLESAEREAKLPIKSISAGAQRDGARTLGVRRQVQTRVEEASGWRWPGSLDEGEHDLCPRSTREATLRREAVDRHRGAVCACPSLLQFAPRGLRFGVRCAVMDSRPSLDTRLQHLWPGVAFSQIERALLGYLLEVQGRVVPRGELLREVWGYHPDSKSQTVNTTVARLRRKVEVDPKVPRCLLNLRNRGYQLIPPGGRAVSVKRPIDRAELERRLTEFFGEDEDWAYSLTAGTARNTNVHLDPTRFVGRQADLAALADLFAAGARVVTLHGTGGLGKTRLASQFAVAQLSAYPGGVWLCDLSEAQNSAEAVSVIADVLGLLRAPGRKTGLLTQLIGVLINRGPTLLVLDNFEHLDPDASLTVARLAREVSTASLLVTSRTRLGIAGEYVHELDTLAPQDAQRMLTDRIEANRRDRHDSLDAGCIADIAALLQGIPLAIEMAAARARILPLTQLRARLTFSFDILKLARPGAPDRHQTMEQTILWSWELLSEEERSALVQFCVFVGGGPIDVAEQVIHARPDPLTVISSLLDKSMLRIWRADGSVRLGLFAGVREFALDQGHTSLEGARNRHSAWALDSAARWSEAYESDPEAGAGLYRERDNLIAAQTWLVESRSPSALELTSSLWTLFMGRDVTRYVGMLHAARAQLSPTGESAVVLRYKLACAYIILGEVAKAESEIDQALELVDRATPLYADLLSASQLMELRRGLEETLLSQALDTMRLAEEGDWADHLPHFVNICGTIYSHLHHNDKALAFFRRAIELSEARGITRWSAIPWANLSSVLAVQGELEAARDCLRRSWAIAKRFNDPVALRFLTSHQAQFHLLEGDFIGADQTYQQLLAQEQRLGSACFTAPISVTAGLAALLVGDPARALSILEAGRDPTSGRTGYLPLLRHAYLLIGHATLDDLVAAERSAKAMGDATQGPIPQDYLTEADLCLGHLDLLRSRRSVTAGDSRQAEAHRASAKRRLDAFKPSARSLELEVTAGLLRRAL
jgi:predicted ATPase